MKSRYMKIGEIPIELRIDLRGSYNPEIINCNLCGANLCITDRTNETRGFAEQNGQVFRVYTCPVCLETLYHHAEREMLQLILDNRRRAHNKKNAG